MSKFFENKRNQIILGITIGIILVGAIVLILTGKIDLKSIMGNTAQGEYTCPEGQGYTLNKTTKKCERTVEVGTAYLVCPGDSKLSKDGKTCVKIAEKKGGTCPSNSKPSKDGKTCIINAKVSCPGDSKLSNDGKTCVASAKKDGTCPTGSESDYISKKCVRNATTKVKSYKSSCDGIGGTLSNDGKYCIKSPIVSHYNYVCNSGTKSDTKCITYISHSTSCSGTKTCDQSGCKCTTSATRIPVYKCSDNTWTLNQNSSTSAECRKYSKSVPATYEYYCPDATWEKKEISSGSVVIPSTYKCYKDFATYIQYSCPDSTWKKVETSSGFECHKSLSSVTATECPDGSWKKIGTSSGFECHKDLSSIVEYTCPDSTWKKVGISSGFECHKALAATNNYVCSTGTPSGTKCIKNESIDATASKTEKIEETITKCNTGLGYEIVNGECVKKCSEGQKRKDGVCVPKQESVTGELTPVCLAGTVLKDGKCVPIEYTPPTIPSTDDKKDDATITLPSDDKNIETVIPPADDKKDETTTPSDDKKDETTTPGVKTCPAGYTQSGDICTKTETINATVKYSCANGYTLNGSKCQRVDTKEPTSTFTCPTGYAKSGNSCYRIDTTKATVTYTCETGYTLNKTTRNCEKVSTINVTKGGYTCPEGYDPIEGTKECIKVTQVNDAASCPYIYMDGECIKVDYQNASTMNSCPTGYTLNGEVCQGKTTVDAISNYKCASGYTLNGKTCTKRINKTVDTKKYCPTGYNLSNNKCQKTMVVAAKATYTCNSGYTLNGKVCTRTLTAELK